MIGFHGCDAEVAYAVINGHTFLRPSSNNYDWLGHGIYFWENSFSRAKRFSEELASGKIKPVQPIANPAVIGAVFDLRNCLDLTDDTHIQLVKEGYQELKELCDEYAIDMPKNHTLNSSNDLLRRELDCAVIEYVNLNSLKTHHESFDCVRSPFIEGYELYPSAGFRDKSHIQICIRNPECIIGYFKPLSEALVRMPVY
ncbi:hypothetical protein ACE38W_04885 [Chitinophaga sp. Hz27]|uniref:hypothetical protein n=1 Tax=Chitinophaga sp. Hz27 TaxID=3347169 RepID=UPI0035E1D2C2